MSNPLNPYLFSRLQALYGHVQISNEGVAATKTYSPGLFNNKLQIHVDGAGEYYRVCCDRCGDGRYRLWINHLFGVPDPVTKSKNLFLAICYNENCLEEYGRAQDLYDRIYGFRNISLRDQTPIVILPGKIATDTLEEVKLPGITMQLNELPVDSQPNYYLRKRDFDIEQLTNKFGITYCTRAEPDYIPAENRLVIPITMRGLLVGWQCRYPDDLDWKNTHIRKYYNRPKMSKRLMLYNYDNAKQYPYVVVTEGVTDVWRVGMPAVALFGKTPSEPQLSLLCEGWEHGAIILLLDGDAQDDALKAAERLKQAQYKGQVVVVSLGATQDPGELSNRELWNIINPSCYAAGVDLSMLKRDTVDENKKEASCSYRPVRPASTTS